MNTYIFNVLINDKKRKIRIKGRNKEHATHSFKILFQKQKPKILKVEKGE